MDTIITAADDFHVNFNFHTIAHNVKNIYICVVYAPFDTGPLNIQKLQVTTLMTITGHYQYILKQYSAVLCFFRFLYFQALHVKEMLEAIVPNRHYLN